MILYLIGNGFDLAHNLPTSYSDFMLSIKNSIAILEEANGWINVITTNGITNKENGNIIYKDTNGKIDKWLYVYFNHENTQLNLLINPKSIKQSIYYKTLLTEFNKKGTWADLEQLYFDLIYKNRKTEKNIKTINEEFEHLKMLLFNYLKEEVEGEIVPKNESIKKHLIENQKEDNNVQFLSFNYTSNLLNDFCNLVKELKPKKNNYDNEDIIVVDLSKEIKPETIHIHGDLSGDSKNIVFGYGDDNSEQYNELKNLLNDDLLENFKTFHYLRNAKYKHTLNLLETSDKIKVVSIGHSLSLCDKTLLKTIFTHKNVKEIEVAYHKDEKEYFKNIYNLARIIDDNEMMRKKVIPLSETLKIS